MLTLSTCSMSPALKAQLLLHARANVSRAALLGLTVAEWRALGDVPGHEFHGNQWTSGVYSPDSSAPTEGRWVRDSSGDAVKWEQSHDVLVKDALTRWKGDASDLRMHADDATKGAPQPSSGGGKQVRAQSEALLWELNNRSKTNDVTLYRASGPTQPGHMTSWTESKKVANEFAAKAQKAGHAPGTIHVAAPGTVRGIRIGDYRKSGNDTEREWITAPKNHRELSAFLRALGVRSATSSRDATPVHRAADAHYKQMMLAVSYGFMRGKKAYKSGGVDAAVKAIKSALLTSLPPVLVKTFVAGGNAGVGMLPKRRAASQGRCETTLTERFENRACSCSTYEGNLGPCLAYEVGGNGQCVYCDNDEACHKSLRSLAPFNIRFDVSSPEAIKWAREHTSKIADDISQTSKDRINEAIAQALEGDGLDAAYDDILAAVGSESRAELIARTECLPGETLVDAAVIGAVHRRWYDGDVVEVTTHDGRQFTTTPNHPMLTHRGWIGAGDICESDYLVCDTRDQRSGASGDVDVASPPATLRELFEAAALIGVVDQRQGTDNDFHGDGRDGDVDVACPFRPLVIGDFAPLYEPTLEQFLAPSDRARAPVCVFCRRLLSVNQPVCLCRRAELNAGRLQAAGYRGAAESERNADGADRFAGSVSGDDFLERNVDGLGALSAREPGFSSDSRAPRLAVPDDIGDFPGSQTRSIQLDRVLSVRIRVFHDHVYNLSTPFGYFTIKGTGSKGKIFTGNTMDAANQGLAASWSAAQDAGLLPANAAKQWVATSDACPDCEELDGEEVPLDEDFSSGDDMPPAHPACRCVASIGTGEAE